jgi:hypothetical protein
MFLHERKGEIMEKLQYNEEIAKRIQLFFEKDKEEGTDWHDTFDSKKGKFVFFYTANYLPVLCMQITVGQNNAVIEGFYGIHVRVDDKETIKKLRQYVDFSNDNMQPDDITNNECRFEVDETNGTVKLVEYADYTDHIPTPYEIGAAVYVAMTRLSTSANAITQIMANDLEEEKAELMQILDVAKMLVQFSNMDDDDDDEEEGTGEFFA